jgi:hypothetical protein
VVEEGGLGGCGGDDWDLDTLVLYYSCETGGTYSVGV